MKVVLYSTHCGKCKALEMKLKQKGINFDIVEDTDKVVEKGREVGINSAPILCIDDKYFDFVQGIKEVNNL